MSENNSIASNLTNNDPRAGGTSSSQALLDTVNKEIAAVNDIYENLSTNYDESAFEKFEKRFIEIRKLFKGKLMDISDIHYSFLNRSEKRKEIVNKILKMATVVAEIFQESRENKRLNRPKCTGALEDLSIELKNLKTLIEQQEKNEHLS